MSYARASLGLHPIITRFAREKDRNEFRKEHLFSATRYCVWNTVRFGRDWTPLNAEEGG